MRYAELTSLPGTPEEARDSIVDIVTVYSGKNKPSIDMKEIIGMLHNKGYDLTPRMVMDVLQDNELIKRITKDEIVLKGGDDDMGMIPDQEKEKAEQHVEKLAKKTIKKDIGKP